MDLARFSSRNFDRGRSAFTEGLWVLARTVIFASANPFNGSRVVLLRLFGASVGRGVVIKPGVKVKFPWRLSIGDHTWIGEDVWIDNLGSVTIGSNSCVSQGAYLCTGNHDWKSASFDLLIRPIAIGSEVWIAARATVAPGVTIGDRAVVTLGAVVTRDVPPGTILRAGGPPQTKVRC